MIICWQAQTKMRSFCNLTPLQIRTKPLLILIVTLIRITEEHRLRQLRHSQANIMVKLQTISIKELTTWI